MISVPEVEDDTSRAVVPSRSPFSVSLEPLTLLFVNDPYEPVKLAKSMPEATVVMAPPLMPLSWRPIVIVAAFVALATKLNARTAADAKTNLPIFIAISPKICMSHRVSCRLCQAAIFWTCDSALENSVQPGGRPQIIVFPIIFPRVHCGLKAADFRAVRRRSSADVFEGILA